MKNKLFTKILSILMAFTLICGIGMPTNAASNTAIDDSHKTVSISVTNMSDKAQAEVNAYQLITFNYDYTNKQPETPAYKWNDKILEWLNKSTQDRFDAYVGTNGEVTNTFMTISLTDSNATDDELFKDFIGAISLEIKANPSTYYNLKETINKNQNNTSVIFENMEMGAYLFLITDGLNIYSSGFQSVYPEYNNGEWVLNDRTLNVQMKYTEPTATKSFVDATNDKTVSMTETIEYAVNVQVPQYPANTITKTFVVRDTFAEGLTYNKDLNVYYKDSSNSEQNVKLSAYSGVLSNEDKVLTITFDWDKLKEDINDIDMIQLKYSADVTENAYAEESLKNTVVMDYNTDVYSSTGNIKTTDPSEVISYTYGFKLTKELFNADGSENETLATGTTFKLFPKGSEDAIKVVYVSDGVYRLPLVGETTNLVELVVSTTDATLTVKGLDLGEYELKETVAPADYVVPTDKVTIILEDSDKDYQLDGNTQAAGIVNRVSNSGVNAGQNNQLDFTVNNYKNDFNLPTTGGIGTMIFTVGGLLVMGAAVVLMVFASKKKKA